MVTQTFIISAEAGMEILKPAWAIYRDPISDFKSLLAAGYLARVRHEVQAPVMGYPLGGCALSEQGVYSSGDIKGLGLNCVTGQKASLKS